MPRLFRSHLRLTSIALASFGLAGLLGCRTPSSKIPLDKLTSESETEVAKGSEASEAVEPLPVERPTDMLPAEVAIMAEAMDPTAVLDLLAGLDEYPELAFVRAELRIRLGADILDPEQWDDLGLDSHGPAGFGLLDIEAEAAFVYLSLVDEAVFVQTIERIADVMGARESLSSADYGDARVYRLSDELSVVVRARVAMFLFVDDPEHAPRDYVVSAAMIDPRESLGHSERFTWAREQLLAADDGMMFIDPAGLFAQLQRGLMARDDDYGVRYAEDELARARSAGESPTRIRELEQRIEVEREWLRERQAQQAGEQQLVTTLFGSIGAFVGAADLRTDGIIAHGRVLMPGEGLLRRLVVVPEHESPLLTTLAEPPVFAIDGRVDMSVMLEVIELFALADGESLATINSKIARETGIDVLSDLIPALDGEGGFALTEARKPDAKRLSELDKTLGLAAYFGLHDPAAIRRILDGVVRAKLLGGALVRAKRGDGWVLHVPKWNDVDLTLVGERLVLATDAKLAKRIRDAEPGSQAPILAATEHPFRGPIANPALRMYGRWTGLAVLDHHDHWEQDAESMLYDMNSHSGLSVDEAAKVPRSREFKRKLAELEKIIDELNRFNRARTIRKFEHTYAFADKLGDGGMQIEPVADGLSIAAQWRFASGTTPLALGFMWFGLSSGDDDWTEQQRISDEMYRVLEELRTIRRSDLDRAAAKK